MQSVEGKNSNDNPSMLTDFYETSAQAYCLQISHKWRVQDEEDYWTFQLQWASPTMEEGEHFIFRGTTDKDLEPEGRYEKDFWTVEFNEATFWVIKEGIRDDDHDGEPDIHEWTGQLSFTVEISRTPHVPLP